MRLREHLVEYTKEELLNQARRFDIRKYSGLRKAELVDRIVDCFCTVEMLRVRLSCLTKEQMELFRKACVAPQDISINEIMDGMQLCGYWIGYFEEATDKFCVFDDVKEVFRIIDHESFRTEQYKKGWMMKCVHFFQQYYGIAPVEIIYELYKLKVKDTIDEMIDMIWEIPMDIIESCIFQMDILGMQGCPKDDVIYSERGLLIYIPVLDDKEFNYLLDKQMDKEFYIPSAGLIDEICKLGYEASSVAYKKLESFFTTKLSLPYEQAVLWCMQVWENSYEGESPADVINKMMEAKVECKLDKQLNEFMGLLISAHNNTRMKENRGHKPDELAKREFAGGMPRIVPGSSHAAELLREAAPQLEAMGISLDLNGNAANTTKKVYPNDPCPCGSGKKYKKCCGKNK
ncbi:MAG: SEC-C metal-binding domain-containing protein [Lachnospiraceae bacterium]